MSTFSRFAEILIPGGAPTPLTYGIPEDISAQPGDWVQVPLARRKDPQPGLILRVHRETPEFTVKGLSPHPCGLRFSEITLDTLQWLSRYYCTPLTRVLDAMLPSEFPRYLELLHAPPKRKLRDIHYANGAVQDPPPLTEEQIRAMRQLHSKIAEKGFRGVLLHGVTGSGKTRIYIELVRHALQNNGRALILVPEIALTPQTHSQFQQYIREPVLLFHSNLSAPQKRATWTHLLRGTARVILGTRSALLAPNFEPDLIILDEEHDPSYKQQDPAPRYHCRDLAFHIAHKRGSAIVLGSATPSLESYALARRGSLELITLKQRALSAPLPKVHLIDMRQASRQDRSLLISPPLREALCDCVAQGHQAIILHNRRGFATARRCLDCGEVQHCASCRVPLILHHQHRGLLCHYCNRLYPADMPCSRCGGKNFAFSGGAIEKVEQELREWIPKARVVRLDRDSVQRIGAAEQILDAFRRGDYNILLGTQMVAKGHDFPGVQCVGIISADVGSSLPDFRSGEKLFQLITQVAGRAGRVTTRGETFLQTWNPDDPALRFALNHDFEGFANHELSQRQELGYPPFKRLMAIEITSKDENTLQEVCANIAQHLRHYADIQTLGPAPAFVPVVRGQHRRHFLLKADNPLILRQAAISLENRISASLRKRITLRLDLDPVGFI